MRKASAARRTRRYVQAFFFILVALIILNHALAESGRSFPWLAEASLHSICPFGGVESLWNAATGAPLVKKVHESSFVLMWISLGLAFLFGPVVCGWVCPLGSLQEWLGLLGRRLFPRRFNRIVPPRIDRALRYLRYPVLAVVLYGTARAGKLVFQDWDPFFALFNFWSEEAAVTSIAILVLVLVLSLLVERPFCKYACPFGAVQGVFNLFRIFGVRRNEASCIHCKACDRACPMNIEVSSSGRVRDHQCITCLECTSELACPVPDTVDLAGFEKPAARAAAEAGGRP